MSVLSRMRIRPRLLAGFGVVLLLFAIVGVVAFARLGSTASTYEDALDHEAAAMADALRMQTALMDQVAGVRGFLLSGDDSYLKRYDEGREAFTAQLDAAAGSNLGETRTAMLAKIRAGWDTLDPVLAKMVALGRAGQAEDAVALSTGPGREALRGLQAEIEPFVERSQQKLDQRASAASDGASTARWLVLGLLLAAIAAGVAVALLIARSIVSPLNRLEAGADQAAGGDLTVSVATQDRDEVGHLSRAFDRMVQQLRDLVVRLMEAAHTQADGAEQMAAAAEQTGQAVSEVATTVDGVAHGSSEQAQAAQEASESVARMSEGADAVAEASEAAALVQQAADAAAREGADRAGEAAEAMSRVAGGSEGIARSAGELATKSQAIGEIVSTIGEISAQTNLLALNAAIEAARAGDAGRGFAVVAEEVRKLAEQADRSATHIGDILGEVTAETQRLERAVQAGRTDVAEGEARVQAATEAFQSIRVEVERLGAEVSRVAATGEALRVEGAAMSDAIGRIAAVSQENAASAEEVAASTQESSAAAEQVASSAGELAERAADLTRLLASFKVRGLEFTDARKRHLAWSGRLEAYMAGQGEPLSAQVGGDHTACGLGKWLAREGVAYADLPEVQEVARLHQAFHAKVRACIEAHEAGRDADARAALAQVRELSGQVVALLERLEDQG